MAKLGNVIQIAVEPETEHSKGGLYCLTADGRIYVTDLAGSWSNVEWIEVNKTIKE